MVVDYTDLMVDQPTDRAERSPRVQAIKDWIALTAIHNTDKDLADSGRETLETIDESRVADTLQVLVRDVLDRTVATPTGPELMVAPDDGQAAKQDKEGGIRPLSLPIDADEDLIWQDRALCAQTDPEAFFPEKGGSTREAKRVCLTCDVREECLTYALDHDERFGIWGGLSERERRKYKKRKTAA